jgi:hypothetical protein
VLSFIRKTLSTSIKQTMDMDGDFVDNLGWLSLMSTLEESPVENYDSTKVWVMDPSLFDV